MLAELLSLSAFLILSAVYPLAFAQTLDSKYETISGNQVVAEPQILNFTLEEKGLSAILLRNAQIDGKSVGNVLLFPLTWTEQEAKLYIEEIDDALQSQTYKDHPIVRVSLSYLRETKPLSVLTSNPLDQKTIIKFGRIDIYSREGIKGAHFGYGIDTEK